MTTGSRLGERYPDAVHIMQSPGSNTAADMLATAVAGDAEMRSVKYTFPTDFLTFQTIRTA